MKQYVATILNMPENTTRTVNVRGCNVYLAHKEALLRNCSNYEEVLKIHNLNGNEIFDLKRGFHGN